MYNFTVVFVCALIWWLQKLGKDEMGWACGTYGEGRGVHRVLVGKPEGKRPLGRPRLVIDLICNTRDGVWDRTLAL
jgi:hypothetical protein